MIKKLIFICAAALTLFPNAVFVRKIVFAAETPKYYTVYSDAEKKQELFTRGEVEKGDQYISADNKLYEIIDVDDKTKTGVAKFIENVKMPKYNVKSKYATSNLQTAKAESSRNKIVGVYHTHNDESYYNNDGYDSVYGQGGIHDVGTSLVKNLEKCNITVNYDQTLHLPHNSGAYSRSQATAARLLDKGSQAIFDIHRDSTPRKEYATTVNGKEMSKVRMVVGRANLNSEANKNFALKIKSYADEVYPNFIKDIYFGKGNYNQQLTNHAMLFEFGSENVEKELCIASTEPLAKTLDVVLYGTESASETALLDVSLQSSKNTSTSVLKGTINSENSGTLDALWIVLSVFGYALLLTLVAFFTNRTCNYKIKRFFSELTAGIFGKKRTNKEE